MHRVALGRSVAAAAGAGLAGSAGVRAARAPGQAHHGPRPEHVFVEEGADGWDVVWNPVTRHEVSQALDDFAVLGGVRSQATLPPLGTVVLEDITTPCAESVTSDGSEADMTMLYAEGLEDGGTPVSPLDEGMIGVLTGLLNNPAVLGPIQAALERDAQFHRLLAEVQRGQPALTAGPNMYPRLALEGPVGEPITLMSLLEGLAVGINEVAARIGDAFVHVTQLLRSLGESLRSALDMDAPVVHGAPGSGSLDPRVGRAVSRLALAVAVFVIFRRAAPGLILRI